MRGRRRRATEFVPKLTLQYTSATPGKVRARKKTHANVKSKYAPGQWSVSQVHYILKRTAYHGVNIFGRLSKLDKKPDIVQEVPAIVSKELWDSAHEALSRHQRFKKGKPVYQYLLSGLLRCGYCGRRLTGLRLVPHRLYYRCTGLARESRDLLKIECRQKYIKAPFLENLVWSEVAGWVTHQRDLERETRQALAEQGRLREEQERSLKKIEKDLSGMETERSRLLTGYRKGLFSDSDLEEQLKELGAEREHLETVKAEIGEQLARAPDPETVIAGLKKSLGEFKRAIKSKTVAFPEKRRLVLSFVHEIVVAVPRGQSYRRSRRNHSGK